MEYYYIYYNKHDYNIENKITLCYNTTVMKHTLEIISIVNQKGGSGKTTTAHALGSGLNKRGYRVLFIDLDGQANLTSTLGGDQNKGKVLDMLMKRIEVSEIIQKASCGDVIAGNESLFQADIDIVTDTGREYRLKEALDEIKKFYDYIIIDTPPALNILTINALVASNLAIITSKAGDYGLMGVERVGTIIEDIKKYSNKNLIVKGILLTQFNERTRLNKDFAVAINKFAKSLGSKIFKTSIRNSIVVEEVQARRMSLFDYAPNSNVAQDYELFIKEFLR